MMKRLRTMSRAELTSRAILIGFYVLMFAIGCSLNLILPAERLFGIRP